MNYFLKALTNYVNFNGRATRSEYWYFFIFNSIIAVGLGLLSNKLNMIYSLAVLLPGIAVSIRRMHDVDKSGWYSLIPIYNFILACTKGTDGDNKYGSDPLRNS